ncbi:MAG: hypothetical protein A2748_00530 [Candidatus Wildermuthbacteria bacterium RIFCSPHIGHO2_01_FULL_45_20]|uniref:Uncharacterized protein n=1 Tax=Candidatus Wildermuthbacteria bacterium RIFCSPHIGHO2_02_FULL_45_25 TaxID=1802450 RepID=A0A1G2R534_9BACT|nr:MAG: hypothetical protein A2748_00530 [Candidatus Wildermuthbacteria bacterium RIFCSPHIGHO2_01_FULL_45_20]OHA67668.1 MAG: hypothetical protein A3C04_01990 [Candidatus Wildermuthbacteria bacterium RIFCSPHIGHO2_02_FULL_45_25]
MDTLVKADIFFFITSIAAVLITLVCCVALFYVVQILRDLRYIVRKFREESDQIINDIEDLRSYVKEEGKKAFNIGKLLQFGSTVWGKRKRSARRKKDSESTSE